MRKPWTQTPDLGGNVSRESGQINFGSSQWRKKMAQITEAAIRCSNAQDSGLHAFTDDQPHRKFCQHLCDGQTPYGPPLLGLQLIPREGA